jgi:hypothetical protein
MIESMKPWAWLMVAGIVLAAAVVGVGAWAVQAQRMMAALARESAHAAAAQAARAEAEAARAEAEASREDKERAVSGAAGAGLPPGAQDAWPTAPLTAGTGEDEAFLVASITIDGLDKAGLTAQDIAGIEIELDVRPPAWGRPSVKRVTIGQISRPTSPLCLYASEVHRIAQSVVDKVNAEGLIGVFVQTGEPGSAAAHPSDGALRWTLYLAKLKAVNIEDRRPGADPADVESLRQRCPLKAGDRINKKKLDAFITDARQRLGGPPINAELSPGEEVERVILTISIGEAKNK